MTNRRRMSGALPFHAACIAEPYHIDHIAQRYRELA
jgi:hypothetical protein